MELITTQRAAAMLGITPDAVRYHERLGHILAIKVERTRGEYQRLFVKQDIERFMRQREPLAVDKGEAVAIPA